MQRRRDGKPNGAHLSGIAPLDPASNLVHPSMRMAFPEPLLAAALALSENDRAELALRLMESLDGVPDEDAESAWADEVAERVQSLQDGRAEVLSFEPALQEARERLRSQRNG